MNISFSSPFFTQPKHHVQSSMSSTVGPCGGEETPLLGFKNIEVYDKSQTAGEEADKLNCEIGKVSSFVLFLTIAIDKRTAF